MFTQPGYPRVVGVADTVGGHADGIIFSNEVISDTTTKFLGLNNPPRTYTVTPVMSFLNGRIRVSSLFDRETGFLHYDSFHATCNSSALCLGPFLPTTPLLDQAKYVTGALVDYLVPGDFTRWRELTVAMDIPQRFLRLDVIHLRFTSATVSLQGRNLKLWTAYTGSDPESRTGSFDAVGFNGIPQARSWSFRFDVTP